MTALIVAATAGAGLVTGLLAAFSICVMKALSDLPNDKGMHAMQRVNEIIINPHRRPTSGRRKTTPHAE